jgi:hypothetical protein
LLLGKCGALLCVYDENNNMRYTFLLFLLMISALSAQAQLGIGGAYLTSSAQHWELRNSGASNPSLQPPGTGYSVGLDYQFRLKKVRIEFAPELNYSHWSTPLTNGLETTKQLVQLLLQCARLSLRSERRLQLPHLFKTRQYLPKGLVYSLVAGHHTNESFHFRRLGRRCSLRYEDQYTVPSKRRVAIGLDLGISELLTVTPHAGWRYFPKTDWPSLATCSGTSFGYTNLIDTEGPLHQFHAGLRLGWRLGRR